jgi:hypothetical protein
MRACTIFMRTFCAPGIGVALAVAALTTSAPSVAAEPWGDASFSVVERYGKLLVGTPDRGKSGTLQGSGLEARFTMPMGWGAYYRWTTAATNNSDRFDWKHLDLAAGFSRRVVAGGSPSLWGFRYQVHLDFGFVYTKLGTNEACTTGIAPFATSCSTTTPTHEWNADGAGIGLEARVGAALGVGPLAIGVDLGVGGFRTLVTGGNSADPPAWFAAPLAQLKVGLAIPFL